MWRFMKMVVVIVVSIVIFQGYAESHWWFDLLTTGNCKVVKSQHDYNNDGTTDDTGSYNYTSDGKVSEILFDKNHFSRFTYDKNGRLERLEYQRDMHYAIVKQITIFHYSSGGNLQKAEQFAGNSGIINQVQYFFYDNDGKIVRLEYDIGNNDIIDEVCYFFYDSNGNIVKSEYDTGSDAITKKGSFFYDSDGKLIKDELLLAMGGVETMRSITTYQWKCGSGGKNGSSGGCYVNILKPSK
jgi:hypothetical protein